MITPERVINHFDGREVGPSPTPAELDQPLFILLDLFVTEPSKLRRGRHPDGVNKREIENVHAYPFFSYTRHAAPPASLMPEPAGSGLVVAAGAHKSLIFLT